MVRRHEFGRRTGGQPAEDALFGKSLTRHDDVLSKQLLFVDCEFPESDAAAGLRRDPSDRFEPQTSRDNTCDLNANAILRSHS
jgi:hypothetical protein